MRAALEKNRHQEGDDRSCRWFSLAIPVLRGRRDSNVGLCRFDLARGGAEENADGERDDATDEDKPRPRYFGPPLGHEPTEVPFRGHQFSPEEREKIEGRNADLA
jgi:hypothetical protein